MVLFTGAEVCEVVGVAAAAELARARVRRVHTDSRSVRKGDLFVALPGERFDAHEFVPAAFAAGAVAALVRADYVPPAALTGAPLIRVADPLRAYQQLAAAHRSQFALPLVAVTGSNGKTTTKEMVARVLGERWRTLKTEGNLNNRIGVAQTLFRLAPRHGTAVIEMGVDDMGQTTRLCEIARPTLGLITNIGPDHLEFFRTMDRSAESKAELLDALPAAGAAILNADDRYFALFRKRARCRVVSFGLTARADVRAEGIEPYGRDGTQFRLVLPGRARRTRVRIRVRGEHNVLNALAAAAVGVALGFSGSAIAAGLAKFRPAAMRSQVEVRHGVRIIVDCYNANPASTRAAVRLLAESAAKGRRIAVLGDMLELGPASPDLHAEVGEFVAAQGIDALIASGELARHLARGARAAGMAAVQEVPDAPAAATALLATVRPGDVVLVKGSRGMRLERVVQALRALST
ncbi:MAG TPA: UDP-N-acetylmuramoyl-tripeptide--D-alanyl-D-alanine ligase [Gammaproteobacteria bacterium]|nr:UDP-N-acetylmuramoyl-tripeptide--D-alanyl-D-alanine ligase [Gammaproteobacteria bacterium]